MNELMYSTHCVFYFWPFCATVRPQDAMRKTSLRTQEAEPEVYHVRLSIVTFSRRKTKLVEDGRRWSRRAFAARIFVFGVQSLHGA